MTMKIEINDLPPPPFPPLEIRRSCLFGGEKETIESRLDRARWEGMNWMWQVFMHKLAGTQAPPAMPNPEACR